MSRSNRDIEQRLKRAVENDTPNVLEKVLLQIKENEEHENSNSFNEPEIGMVNKKPKSNKRWVKWAGSVAALFVLVIGIYSVFGYMAPKTTISFDVNPSIELTVDKSDKVLSATALNEDGNVVLGDMDLKNSNLDVAVNAIIGSMVKNGYISEINNSVLVSIDSANDQKGSDLQTYLLNEVSSSLDSFSLEGAVISQVISDDEQLEELAEQYNISLGKARLIDLLVNQDASLDFESLANLSMNDICLLITSRYPNLGGIEKTGEASSESYIGEDRAREIALEHAGIDEASVLSYKTELDFNNYQMIYNIEFKLEDDEYEYTIDAETGNIIGFEKPANTAEDTSEDENTEASQSTSDPEDSNSSTNENSLISAESALNIALSNAGITADSLEKQEVKLDKDHDTWIYKIELKTNDHSKYQYKINASTGAIIESSAKS